MCGRRMRGRDALTFLKTGLPRWPKNSLIYLDPPYYDQGRELYYDYYKPKDHADLASFIKRNMRNRFWMISYDNIEAIKALYCGFRSATYSVGYTAREQRVGKEVMFFSDKLQALDLIGPVQQLGKITRAA